MALSDRIEAFITELLRGENNDWIELKRNELASVFNCGSRPIRTDTGNVISGMSTKYVLIVKLYP